MACSSIATAASTASSPCPAALGFGTGALNVARADLGLPASLLPASSAPVTLTGTALSIGPDGAIAGSLNVSRAAIAVRALP